MKILVFILSVVAVCHCVPVAQEESVVRLVLGNFVNCMNSDLSLCLKEHALKAAQRLGAARKLSIIEGITLLNNNPREGKSLEPLSTDVEVRKQQVSQRLWDSTADLLQNSDLELSYPSLEEEKEELKNEESRAIEDVDEGRGKKKKQLKRKLKILVPLAILAKVKAVALFIFFIGVIAASVFKLALIAKIAFWAKIIALVKALIVAKKSGLGGGGGEGQWVSYVEDHGHGGLGGFGGAGGIGGHGGHGGGGWDGGWSRSKKDDAQNLAYSAYKN